MEEIKIKLWYLFKVNKKQFLFIYIFLSFLVILGGIWAFYHNPVITNNMSVFRRFYLKNDVTFWFVLLLYTIIEALFFWNNFNKEHIKIINLQKDELENQKEEIRAQNEEISTQRDQAIAQKEKLEKQEKQIEASIIYAQRIQNAVFPITDELSEYFDNFILFRPRDIVSGDFYWFDSISTENKDLHFIAAVDCTGHGVPGAFVSMLGISLLKEIINNRKIYSANLILNELRKNVKSLLHQKNHISEQQDGMDIAFVKINKKEKRIEFAGANNPIYICRDGKFDLDKNNKRIRILHTENRNLLEIKPDKMPVGVYTSERDFSSFVFEYQSEDIVYLFSDGYIDQFGGNQNQKFMSINFKKLLLKASQITIKNQKEYLNKTLDDWIGQREQIDDILVMGIKL